VRASLHRGALAAAIALAFSGGAEAQANGAFQGLGFLGTGSSSIAAAVSADGSVVVGTDNLLSGLTSIRAFRWTSGGGMADLGTLGGTFSNAFGVSADGSVVVGLSVLAGDAGGHFHAFRWTSGGGMADLGTLGGTQSKANGASADGSVVVGFSRLAGNVVNHAFRWTSGGGMADLGSLGGTESIAHGVSANGSVVVGESTLTGDAALHAFRWTNGGGMADLGTLGGSDSVAFGVSGDGKVVVGGSNPGVTLPVIAIAFRWTQATGMQSVPNWLAAGGVSVPSGWEPAIAFAANSNGNVVVGVGTDPAGHTEASFLARVGPAGTGTGLITDLNAFNATLIEAGGRAAQAGVDLPNLALFGVHHRSLLDSGLAVKAGESCTWVAADGARYNASDNEMELAEVGVCKDLASTRFGVGLGNAWSRQGWNLGGGAKFDGQYLIAEADHAFGRGLEASLTAYYGRFHAELHRNYLNGAATNASTGKPDATATAARARLDWKDVAQAGRFGLSPYAAYTWTQSKLDAYTETGGGFPATFGAAKWTSDDLRAGLAAMTELSAATHLRLAGELVHRFTGSTRSVGGQVVGLFDFSVPGQELKQDWVRATLDVDHRLSDRSLLTFSANAATSGNDPSYGVSVSYKAAF